MKKIVIVGSGTAGLLVASMMNRYWKDQDIQITIIHDSNNKTIGVGESTTPVIHQVLQILRIDVRQLVNKIGATIKYGINFKDWIPDKEFFHGFEEINPYDGSSGILKKTYDHSSAYYGILNGKFNGGSHYNYPVTEVSSDDLRNMGTYALHIDTNAFCELLTNKVKDIGVKFIDDIVEDVNVDGENIKNITCKNSGIIDADFFVDASGFNCVLFKHLNPKWVDTSGSLPIDRAIPQQVSNTSGEVPSYTLAQATDNGWIWQLPIGDRYGTGYLYSSKFTSDQEAREKYNNWLLDNHGVTLDTDRIIKYRPGYYEDYWIGNCMVVGLSAGFIEPLESTSLHLLLLQAYDFLIFNSTLNNLEYTRRYVNSINRSAYEGVFNFICFHYCTNRTDSEFWKYMTNNKTDWVKAIEEKCNKEFLDLSVFGNNKNDSFSFDSYIQIGDGLNLFNRDSLREFLVAKPHGQEVLDTSERLFVNEQIKRDKNRWVSHKEVLDRNKYLHGKQ